MADLTDYRLDIYAGPEGVLMGGEYFQAPSGIDAVPEVLAAAQRLLVAEGGPDDRYGEIYEHTGHGSGAFYDLVELPETEEVTR